LRGPEGCPEGLALRQRFRCLTADTAKRRSDRLGAILPLFQRRRQQIETQQRVRG